MSRVRVASIITLAMVLSSCGGSSEPGAVEFATTAASVTTAAPAEPMTVDEFIAELEAIYDTPIAVAVEDVAPDDAALAAYAGVGLLTDAYANAVLRTWSFEMADPAVVDDSTWETLGAEAVAAWARFAAIRAEVEPLVVALPAGVSSLHRWQTPATERCQLIRPGDPGSIETLITPLSRIEQEQQLRNAADCREEIIRDNVRATRGMAPPDAVRLIMQQYNLTDVALAQDILNERVTGDRTREIMVTVAGAALSTGFGIVTGGVGGLPYLTLADAALAVVFDTVDHPFASAIEATDWILILADPVEGAQGIVEGVVFARLSEALADEINLDVTYGAVEARVRPTEPAADPDSPWVVSTTTGARIDLSGALCRTDVQQWRQTPCPGDELIGRTEARLAMRYPLTAFLVESPPLYSGTYLGTIPYGGDATLRYADVPVLVIVGDDGMVESAVEWSGSQDLGGGVTMVMTMAWGCTGSVDAEGNLECIGDFTSTTSVTGGSPYPDQVGTFVVRGAIADSVLTATVDATSNYGYTTVPFIATLQ